MRIDNNSFTHKPDQQSKVNKQPNEQLGQRFSPNIQFGHGIKLSLSGNSNTQIQELFAKIRILQNGISLTQVADNALTEIDSILLRMLEITIQSNTETTTDAVRHEIQAEIDQLATEMNRIANQLFLKFIPDPVDNSEIVTTTAQFNQSGELVVTVHQAAGEGLNQGSITATVRDLIEILRDAGLNVNVAENITDSELKVALTRDSLVSKLLPAGILNEEAEVDVTTRSAVSRAVELINGAMTQVAAERSKLGDVQQRLQHLISELGTFAQNINVDETKQRGQKATEKMTTLSKYNFLAQAVNAIMAKVNNRTNAKITFVWFGLFVIILWLIIKTF